MITFHHTMTAAEYGQLRESVGWEKLSASQREKGLEHTTHLVVAREDGRAVGMARVLFDYGFTAYIADVIVHPDYQRRGIGSSLMERILGFLNENSEEGSFRIYALISAEGKEEFYRKFGFQTHPAGYLGAGMTLTLRA